MKNISHNLLILFSTVFCCMQTSAQVKKPAAKKAVVAAKPKTTLAKSPVAHSNPSVKPHSPNTTAKNTTVKKIIPVTKPVVNAVVPNKPVNNTEITNVTLTSREQEMINEINNLRANPAKYCTYVENYLQKYDADDNVKVAAKELLGVLKKTRPLNPLAINTAMYNDAKQYGMLMAKRNIFEHSSLPYYENLSLGYKDIRDAIVDMLIDDGIPDRGHRNNLLNEKIKNVAVYELPGKVQDIGFCYVQEFK